MCHCSIFYFYFFKCLYFLKFLYLFFHCICCTNIQRWCISRRSYEAQSYFKKYKEVFLSSVLNIICNTQLWGKWLSSCHGVSISLIHNYSPLSFTLLPVCLVDLTVIPHSSREQSGGVMELNVKCLINICFPVSLYRGCEAIGIKRAATCFNLH